MQHHLILSLIIATQLHAEDVVWQLEYDAKKLPGGTWSAVGTPEATLESDGLRIKDGGTGFGHYRADWKAGEANSCMKQMFSHDAGKTWTTPVQMEEGRVMPDLVMISNGVLACSYGRLLYTHDAPKTTCVYVNVEKITPYCDHLP